MNLELAAIEFAVLFAAVAIGAVVRGYAGFGAGLIWVSSLTLVLDPDQAIPIVVMLEIVVSATLYSASRESIAWPAVSRLAIGAIVGLPLGVAVLTNVSADRMALVISTLVLLSAIVLASGWQIRREPTAAATVATGVASGVMNGVTGAGGPPVIVFFLGSPTGIRVGRASMSIYFGITDMVAVVVLAMSGLVDATALSRTLAFVPAVYAGARIGERGFHASEPARVRTAAIALLVGLAVAGIGRRLAG